MESGARFLVFSIAWAALLIDIAFFLGTTAVTPVPEMKKSRNKGYAKISESTVFSSTPIRGDSADRVIPK